MKYIIGVDSGGTSTKAAAYDLEGHLLKETQTGFGNLLNNAEEALANIRQSLVNIFEELGEENCQLVVLGVAGVDSGDFREMIQNDLAQFTPEVIILNDAWMAHYALLNGEDGCLVISGTGSIVIGKFQNEEGRVGGYGNLLGDEGSGYDIAKELIKSALNSFDKGQPFSELEESLLKTGNFQTVFELVKFVYSSSKDQVADLSMVVVDKAAEGNEQAIQILEKAGLKLADQVSMLIKKIGMQKNPNVAVTGSVLVKNDIVYEAFVEKIKSKYSNCKFVRRNISNTIGGYYYYKRIKQQKI
jgi:Predicted N-acetylglucosamine kinase